MPIEHIMVLLDKARASILTCSQVAEVLMRQNVPTSSHAHVHARDGFRRDEALIKDASTVAAKRIQWQGDSHLFPFGGGQQLVDFATASSAVRLSQVTQQAGRVAVDQEYNLRTNLPGLPGVPGHEDWEYSVKQIVPGVGKVKGTMAEHRFPTKAEAEQFALNNPGMKFVPTKGGGGAQVSSHLLLSVPTIPPVAATSSHSMWEDSESMVMHLTALLLSTAGKLALEALNDPSRESTKSVAVMSKTAVRAVAAHVRGLDATAAVPLVHERTADTDAHRTRTGTYTDSTAAMDHVVASFYRSGHGTLVVNTFYPTARDTFGSCRTATSADQEILELNFGSHTVMPVDTVLPTLKW